MCSDGNLGQVYTRPAGEKPVVLVRSDRISCTVIYLSDTEMNPQVLYYNCKKLKPYTRDLTDREYELYREVCTKYYITPRITKQNGESTMTTKLYEVNSPLTNVTIFATKLAVNSSGDWVMEEKGTGRVFATSESECVEVKPYTIDVEFLTGPEGSVSRYSYTAKKGVHAEGDLYLIKGSKYHKMALVSVVGIDTKSNSATKDFTPIGKISVDKVT